MDCLNLNLFDYNGNYLYPIIGLCGLCITYLGNRFVRPTIFSLGTIISMESSYKLTHLIMEHYNYTKHECLIKNGISIISGFSGGLLLLKLYKLTNFFLGFVFGGSLGYLSYDILYNNNKLDLSKIYDKTLLLSVLIPGVSMGFIAIYNENKISMLTTSFIGPLLTIWSFNEFTNYYELYLFILSYIILSLSGFYIQYKRYKNDKINNTIKNNFNITYNGKNNEKNNGNK